ncbi:MAG: hypothetical protein JJU13_16655 [Balneolaceae bacterium]|nr:hypothetical protein [Balneolaceae bacterium]
MKLFYVSNYLLNELKSCRFNNLPAIFFCLFLFAVLAKGCSSSTESGSENPDDFPEYSEFDAELGSETVMLEESVTEAALTEYDEENHQFIFNSSVLENAGVSLKEGEILLLANKALRRITSVSEEGGEITVETGYASINEAFRNVKVDHTERFDFRQSITENAMLEFDGKMLKPNVAGATGETKWEYKLGDVTVEGTLNRSDNEAVLALLVKYDTGSVSGAMLARLTISGFENNTAFTITDHETESFRFNNRGLEGRVDMQFVMAGGNSDEVSWEPPMPALVLPFSVGVIPLTFRMGPVYVYKLDLGADGSAQFETAFTYSGDLGLQVEGTSFTPMLEGGIRNPGADQAEGNAAGFGGTVSGQYGLALPKISLSAFGDAVVPYLTQEFYIGASYTFPTCTRLFSRYEINAGVAMRMFGLANLNFSQNLVEETMHDYRSDGCGASKEAEVFPYISIHSSDIIRAGEAEVPFRIW